MKVKIIHLLVVSQILTACAFIIGFNTFHQWTIVSVLFLSVCLLWIGVIKSWQWTNNLVFVLQLSLAIIGALMSVSPYLMIAGSVGALASWDLIDLLTKQKISTDILHFEKYKNNRQIFLGFTIGIGVFFAEIGLFIHIKLPFVIVFLIGLIVLFCLYKMFSILKR